MTKSGKKMIEALQNSLAVAQRRGGPGFDYPCNDPNIIECAIWDCQKDCKCRKPAEILSRAT
jgi:hypothetical protein